jgi:hypothetical protein
MFGNTVGNNNIALGWCTLYSSGGGVNNIAVGQQSNWLNTTGSSNISLGFFSLSNNTTGCDNIAFGLSTLGNVTTGCNNLAFGRMSGTTGNSTNGLVNITTQSNNIVMGNVLHTAATIQIAWSAVSDARDKIVGGAVPHGLEFVKQLEPVTFHFKKERDVEELHGPKRYGFLAQDILALEGDDPVLVNAEDEERLKLTDAYITPILVNAIKELAADFEEYKRTHP